jgi:hypothetical protein
MSIITKTIGALMAAFGVFMFARSKAKHVTGLFPGLIGLLLVGLGFAGKHEAAAGKATAAAAGVAVAGLLVPLQGLLYPGLFPATAPEGPPHPDRRLAQAGTALLSALYLGLLAGAAIARRVGRR